MRCSLVEWVLDWNADWPIHWCFHSSIYFQEEIDHGLLLVDLWTRSATWRCDDPWRGSCVVRTFVLFVMLMNGDVYEKEFVGYEAEFRCAAARTDLTLAEMEHVFASTDNKPTIAYSLCFRKD